MDEVIKDRSRNCLPGWTRQGIPFSGECAWCHCEIPAGAAVSTNGQAMMCRGCTEGTPAR